jgi:hypothetical protein
MNFEEKLDKNFEINEDTLIKWVCKKCKKENREFIKDIFHAANLAATACYDCGGINILDLKRKEVIK